jgi:hypothetical protein
LCALMLELTSIYQHKFRCFSSLQKHKEIVQALLLPNHAILAAKIQTLV